MSWTEIFSTSGLTVALLAALVFILKNWFISHLKESIRWESVKKEKATAIAEIISLWLLHNYDKKRDPNLIRYELQRKYWELSLWLDAATLRILNKALLKKVPAGISHKKALSAVRKLNLGDRKDPVKPEEFIHWDPVDTNKKE